MRVSDLTIYRNLPQKPVLSTSIDRPMHIIVVDTETTGLIPKGIASSDLAKCPHIVQLSYMVLNTKNFKIREDYDAIIRLSDDVEISERSIEIHKITREKSQMCGTPIKVALYNLKRAVSLYGVDLIVGHNIEFDTRMLDIECRRNGLIGLFSPFNAAVTSATGGIIRTGLLDSHNGPIPLYCTMENSKDLCNNRVQSMYGGTYMRFSKLGEVFEKIFGVSGVAGVVPAATETAHSAFMHNSRVDVIMCLRIFIWITYSVDIVSEWVDVISSYTDTDLIVIDDAHMMTDEIVRTKYDIRSGTLVCA